MGNINYKYLADFIIGRNGETIYVSLYRRSQETLLPEEYVDGEWKTTKVATHAFNYEGGYDDDEFLGYPTGLSEMEAMDVIKSWKKPARK